MTQKKIRHQKKNFDALEQFTNMMFQKRVPTPNFYFFRQPCTSPEEGYFFHFLPSPA